MSVPPHDDLRSVLIELGEIEAGVADAMSPGHDGTGPLERMWRALLLAAGRLCADSCAGAPGAVLQQQLQALCHQIDRAIGSAQPRTVGVSVPEGYAYYCVYPEAYRAAAAEIMAARPAGTRTAVVGLRSIGTSLSAIVAGEIARRGHLVDAWTVRPRGHPYQRQLVLTSELADCWRAHAGDLWIVVDEGPGLSGSSVAATADTLVRLGADARAIVLLSHWRPDPSGFAPAVEATWRRHPHIAAGLERVLPAEAWLSAALGATSVRDLSGGAWRDRGAHGGEPVPAVIPAFERRKWLIETDRGPRFVKFAGLGRYGRGTGERANWLAESGWGPAVEGLFNGFLVTAAVPGRPARPGDADGDAIDRIGRYIGWIGTTSSRAYAPTAFDGLREMTVNNVAEAIGDRIAADVARAFDAALPALRDRVLVHLDGRMQCHEWLVSAAGLIKTDGHEHHDDHFFPGPLDPAWDLAAVIVEFGLGARKSRRLLAHYERFSGDRPIAHRLPLMMVAYLAFRLGYATLGAGMLGATADGVRMATLRDRYDVMLRHAVGRLVA